MFEYLTSQILKSRILKSLFLRAAHRPPQAATGRHRLPQAGKPSGSARGSPPPYLTVLEGSAAEAVACKPGIAAKRKAHWSCSALDGVFCSLLFFFFSVFGFCVFCLSFTHPTLFSPPNFLPPHPNIFPIPFYDNF